MKCVFIILNFNSKEITGKLANKISNMKNINKVIVVDNCSTDDSYDVLSSIKNERIDVIKSEKNGGYSYGNNYGVRYAQKYNPDVIFLSNPDVDIEENVIDEICRAFEKTEYALLSAVEYDSNNMISEPAIWKRQTYKDDLFDCLYLMRRIRKIKKIDIDYSKVIQDTEIVKGSFLAIKNDAFNEIGGFDENVFLFCEERILSKKLSNFNKKIGLVTNLKYNHNHSASINKAYKLKSKQMMVLYKSRLYYNKCYNKVGFLKLMLLKAFMNISIIEFLLLDFLNIIRKRISENGLFTRKIR